MSEYLSAVNAPQLYLLVALVLTVMTAVCFVFLIKSYRAGIKLGVIALSGSLGMKYFAQSLRLSALALVLGYVLWKKDLLN